MSFVQIPIPEYGQLKKPFIPSINKYSWDFAFMLKLLKDRELHKRYLIFLDKLIDEVNSKYQDLKLDKSKYTITNGDKFIL